MKTLAHHLASLVQARENCAKSGNSEWMHKHESRAVSLVREHMPSGSGFDCATNLEIDRSSAELLVFTTRFHHMNENEYYSGWTHHCVRVRASLVFGLTLTISGPNRNDIKDHIHESFSSALNLEVSDHA